MIEQDTYQYYYFFELQQVPSSSPSDPEGLQFVLQYLSEAYSDLPIYVQENGKSNIRFLCSSMFWFSCILIKLLQCLCSHHRFYFTEVLIISPALSFLFSGNVSNDTIDDTDRVEYLKTYMGSTLKALRLVDIHTTKIPKTVQTCLS